MSRGFHQLVHQVMGTWTVTPYGLCDYRCSYCCTGVQGVSTPIVDAERAVVEIRDALEEAGPDSFWVIGGLADAYPAAEAEHRLTRAVMELVMPADVDWCIVTKSLLVERDVDLLRKGAGRGVVTVSIASTDDDALARLDGHAPLASERIALVHRLHAAGVAVDVNALPFLPGVTDLEALAAAVPDGIRIAVSPLLIGEGRDETTLAGVRYRRAEVWDAYMAEWERLGDRPDLSWIQPSPPPGENNPFVRLQRLDAPLPEPSELRRRVGAEAEAYADAVSDHSWEQTSAFAVPAAVPVAFR